MFRPDISAMFVRLNDEHFNGEIPDIPIVWNTRMTTTAGYCRYKRGIDRTLVPTKIDMSDKLFRHLDYDLSKIERTMIHEMVHAYLVHKYNEKGHTARFQRMMTNITGEYKNHRCHSYNTEGLRRKEPKNVVWRCSRCGFEGRKARMPRSGRKYTHSGGCGGVIAFFDMRKNSSKIDIF